MSRVHHFQTDHRGDSITVETRSGLTHTDVELLVDGKVVAIGQIHGAETCTLTAELPGEMPNPFRVVVTQLKNRGDLLCTLTIDGIERPMAEAYPAT